MKNFTLLFACLLPLFIFSQDDLSNWSSSSYAPSVLNQYVNPENTTMSISGINMRANSYGSADTFFESSGWATPQEFSGNPNPNKYIQFKIAPKTGFRLKLNQFNFTARTQGRPTKFKIEYSKVADFSSGVATLSTTTVTSTSYVEYTNSFPTAPIVLSNEILYVRLYVYNTNNAFHIQYDQAINSGTAFKGTIISNSILAVNDTKTIDKNISTSIDVLTNDFAGPNGNINNITSVTTPSNGLGTVTINANNTLQFIPKINAIGSSTFQYSITGTNGTSTATVTVKISEPIIAEWNLTSNNSVSYQNPSVTASKLAPTGTTTSYSNSGMALANFSQGGYEHYRFFDIQIKPKTGESVDVTQLVFDQERLVSGNLVGPSNYSIRYKVVTSTKPSDYDFFDSATILIDESISANPVKEIPLNVSLDDTQTLVIRFYAKNANDYNFLGWRIKANTLKLRGIVVAPCAPPSNDSAYGNDIWNGYVYTYMNNATNFQTATYIGTVKENTIFDRNLVSGAVDGKAGSRDIPCVTPPVDQFMVRYKTKMNFTPGHYNFTVGADDGYRLSFDGGNTWEIDNWTTHSYVTTSKLIYLSGEKNVVLEYFESYGDARVSFSYGKVEGDPTVYGNNAWNVYVFSNNDNTDNQILVPFEKYSGFYTQPTLGIDTRDISNNGWNQELSPSASAGWKGAPVSTDNFTISHKRQGFPCGKYQIIMSNWDDKAILFINGKQIWNENNYNGGSVTLPGIYALDKDSKIELRLKENSGDAGIKMQLIDIPTIFSATSSPSASQIKGSAVIIKNNFTLSEDLDVCSCTIAPGYTLTIPENKTLVIDENLTIEDTASLVVENNGSLVQKDDNAINKGVITLKRTTAPVKRYDFTYWSSPVASGYTLNQLSPNTLADKYYSYIPTRGWYIHQNGNTAMEAGKGYIVRAPQNHDLKLATEYKATFVGTPNNGIITQNISPNLYSLIGNPYPSAISADALYARNSNEIDGTFYFWTHNTPPSGSNPGNHAYNYSSDDYASYNLVGGVKTTKTASGGKAPTGNIASGQSFFVTGTARGGDLQFSNAMRVKEGDNAQFFRSSDTIVNTKKEATIEKHRLWLNISNETGSFNETLIGYITNASNGLDKAFDGASFSSGNTTLYTLVDDEQLVIQGRALPFSNQDIVALGIKIASAGKYTINMDQFDGLFENQDIYLFDNLTNTFHNLKTDDYVFTSEKGTFNSRFQIRYMTDNQLGIDAPIISNRDITVYTKGSQIVVKSNSLTIDNVQIYDLTGKVIFSKSKINNSEFLTSGLNAGTQVVIVKVNLDDTQSVSKKVMMN